jgi:hypothetical protein
MALPFKAELERDGFIFISGAKGRLKLDGFPDFYQTACHTKEYVKKQWSEYFEVLDYVERGINNHQDAVVLKKPIDALGADHGGPFADTAESAAADGLALDYSKPALDEIRPPC